MATDNSTENFNDIINKFIELDIKFHKDEYKLYFTEDFETKCKIRYRFRIIEKNLNSDSNIPLYIIFGLSNTSICNNFKIIINNIDKIKKKYNKIIIIILSSIDTSLKNLYDNYIQFYQYQTEEIQNYMNIKNLVDVKKLYIISDMFKNEISYSYYKVIENINKLNNYIKYDLMGVSFGGGIAVFISQISLIELDKLFLISPGITEGLKNINKNQKIILLWCIQDTKIPYKPIGIKLENELYDLSLKNKFISIDLTIKNPLIDIENELNVHCLHDEIFDYLD